jgi:hypothetical protein
LSTIQRLDQKLCPFRTVTQAGATDLIITEYPFLIHSVEKGIRKLQ